MSTTIGIIGLIVGICVMILFAFKGLSAVPLTLLAGAVICVFNGINLWDGLGLSWASGVGTAFTSYYLLFFVSSVYANIMELTGACTSIAYKFLDVFGTKHILTVLTLFVFVITYGGVSFFVCMFAVAPITFKLFKELNVPRPLSIIPIAAGGGAWVYLLPGSTQLSNVIPTALGTTLTAAPIFSIIIVFTGMLASIIVMEKIYASNMAKVSAGLIEGFTGEGADQVMRSRDDVPSATASFIPLIFMIGMVVVCSFMGVFESSTLLACLAMFIASIICLLINWKYIKGAKLSEVSTSLTKGAGGAASSALALGAVIGFGAIVSSTDAFQSIIDWLIALDINTYWKAVISTSTIAGVTGSASSGVRLCMDYLQPYFVSSGADLQILHRLISLASITFDSLPHCSGCFIMFAYLGLNHKNSYKYTFIFDTVLTVIWTIIFTIIACILF